MEEMENFAYPFCLFYREANNGKKHRIRLRSGAFLEKRGLSSKAYSIIRCLVSDTSSGFFGMVSFRMPLLYSALMLSTSMSATSKLRS